MYKNATLSVHTFSSGERHLDLFLENDLDLFTLEIDFMYLDFFFQGIEIPYQKKANHRLIYLNYEGEISQNRGNVKILWKGLWQPELVLDTGKIKLYTQNNLQLINFI